MSTIVPLSPLTVRPVGVDECCQKRRVGSPGRPGTKSPPPLLMPAGVHAFYGRAAVLHEVDLTVGQSECVAFVGESGSGKTTLARCIIGIRDR